MMNQHEPYVDGTEELYKRDMWNNLNRLFDESLCGKELQVVREHYLNERSFPEIAKLLEMEEGVVAWMAQGAAFKIKRNFKLSSELRELYDDLMVRWNKA